MYRDSIASSVPSAERCGARAEVCVSLRAYTGGRRLNPAGRAGTYRLEPPHARLALGDLVGSTKSWLAAAMTTTSPTKLRTDPRMQPRPTYHAEGGESTRTNRPGCQIGV